MVAERGLCPDSAPYRKEVTPDGYHCFVDFKELTPDLALAPFLLSGFYGLLLTPSTDLTLWPFAIILSLMLFLLETSPARFVPKKLRIPFPPDSSVAFFSLFPPHSFFLCIVNS